jgi:uncharacterized protein YjbI with pentapeptide repeats
MLSLTPTSTLCDMSSSSYILEEVRNMATKRELTERWSREPGKSILQQINDFCFGLQLPGHGHTSEEIFALLDGLPYREEVANGRDLRGAMLGGGVHELDFRECDFTFARFGMNLVNCDLTGAHFDDVAGGGNIILKTLRGASFRRAKLHGCFFQNAQAQACSFDQATLIDASFEGADLSGSSFQKANCKRAKFLRATLAGCDFRAAILDEAVFQEVALDKTTDLRGASLVNLYHHDHRDKAGNLVARGADWRCATYDPSTRFGNDPAAMAIEILDAASTLLETRDEPAAGRLREVVEQTRTRLRKKFDPAWYDAILEQFDEPGRPYVTAVLTQAVESLVEGGT